MDPRRSLGLASHGRVAGRVARSFRTAGSGADEPADVNLEREQIQRLADQGLCAVYAPEGFFLRPTPSWAQAGPHYLAHKPVGILAASTETNAGNRMYRVKLAEGLEGYAVFATANMRSLDGICSQGFAGLASFSAPVPSGGGGGGGGTTTCPAGQTLVAGRCVAPTAPPTGPAVNPSKAGTALLLALGVAGLALVYVNRRPIRKALGM